MSADRRVYVDSSALVKLVLRESFSTDLAVYLNQDADQLVSSALARVEIVRAVRVAEAGAEAEEDARDVLAACSLLDVDRDVLDDACVLAGPSLGTLDAIHLASARRFGTERLVTYDRQLGRAATQHGFRVAAPGAVS